MSLKLTFLFAVWLGHGPGPGLLEISVEMILVKG